MSPTENKEHLVFILQDMAQDYYHSKTDGMHIVFCPISKDIIDGVRPSLSTNISGTIQHSLWFENLSRGSGLCCKWDLNNIVARGVLNALEAPQKITEKSYT